MSTTERRQIELPLTVGQRDDGKGLRITGYGAVFYREGSAGTEYRLMDDYVERIAPGAFDETAEKDDNRGLFNHDSNQILGRISAGTMRLSVDKTGLRYDIDLPDNDVGKRVATSIERGDITGSSFSFRARRVGIEDVGNGQTVRELQDVQVMDVGPVTYPAYSGTSADVRSESTQTARDELMAWKAAKEADKRIRQKEADQATVAADLASLGFSMNTLDI